jgi:hypothetical protein
MHKFICILKPNRTIILKFRRRPVSLNIFHCLVRKEIWPLWDRVFNREIVPTPWCSLLNVVLYLQAMTIIKLSHKPLEPAVLYWHVPYPSRSHAHSIIGHNISVGGEGCLKPVVCDRGSRSPFPISIALPLGPDLGTYADHLPKNLISKIFCRKKIYIKLIMQSNLWKILLIIGIIFHRLKCNMSFYKS